MSDAQPGQPADFYTSCKASILIIEDDYDTGDALTLTLARRGHGIRIVENRQSALTILHRYPPDLILMDFNLPGMGAPEFVTELRRSWPEVKLILMTADSRIEQRAKDLRIQHWLKKPFALEQLMYAIQTVATPRSKSEVSLEHAAV